MKPPKHTNKQIKNKLSKSWQQNVQWIKSVSTIPLKCCFRHTQRQKSSLIFPNGVCYWWKDFALFGFLSEGIVALLYGDREHLCVCVCVSESVCETVCVSLCLSACTHICMFGCVCAYVCGYVCICVCVRTCVCVCVFVCLPSPSQKERRVEIEKLSLIDSLLGIAREIICRMKFKQKPPKLDKWTNKQGRVTERDVENWLVGSRM
jgi:hypothetical protein